MDTDTSADEYKNNKNDRFLVKYRHRFYDITNFLHKHPGGMNTLKALKNSDMTERFLKAPPHSDAAMYLLKEYKIKGERKSITPTKTKLTNGLKTIEGDLLDESMEHLVDWSQAMVPQIARIAPHYSEWVHKPVDRPLRLFQPWYLEICTRTPWWVIPLFWIPIIITFIYSEASRSWTDGTSVKLLILLLDFLCGILLWSFVEYCLHRWVFHIKINQNSGALLCTLHFLIHGLHHKVPFDSYRLVFPPVPGVILAAIFYTPVSFILPNPKVLMGGSIFGYLCYDLMHYYLHHGNPTMRHMYHMKRYHFQHHFAHQNIGFGITSPMWDFVFNTKIQIRKLRYRLIWK